jgi:deoxyribose-phosphate aldolase
VHDDKSLVAHIVSLVDLTRLQEEDSPGAIRTFCEKAITPYGNVAAVCLYPQFIPIAKEVLAGTSIRIATVANFPEGKDSLQNVLDSIALSLEKGADEIDVVFPYERYLLGEREYTMQFIQQCKKAVSQKILKVILEVSAFKNPEMLKKASQDMIAAGADFLKTSTGKSAGGATLASAEVILKVIQESHHPIGFKVSGGVRTIEDAKSYISLAERLLGKKTISPNRFRLGTSQLIENLTRGAS